MEFVVPKFIERELRIIGPITFKQFIHLAIAGAICFVIYFLAPRPVFWISLIFLGGGSFALAFLKVEGRPVVLRIFNFFKFLFSPKLYIWRAKKVPFTITKLKTMKEEESPLTIGGVSELKRKKKEVEIKKEVEEK
jgi:hypothetical protein